MSTLEPVPPAADVGAAERAFPALAEKCARLENSLAAVTGELVRLQEEAARQSASWTLVLSRDGREVARWSVSPDNPFGWEGDGFALSLTKSI